MKFMTFVRSIEAKGPPPQALMDAIAKLGEEGTRNGTLVQTGGLIPSAMGGATVSLRGGKISVKDGPFTEAKEVIGGFAVFELNSREEAIEAARKFMELHKQHWPGWEGETEVRQIWG